MSRIDDLIRDLHPNGVERIPLCKIATFNKGSNLKELQRTPGPFPVVTASRRETSTHSEFNFEGESITISTHGAYAGFVSYWNQPIYLSNNVFLIKPQNSQLLSRYLYHYLKLIQPNIQSMRKQGGIPYINTRDLASTPIPKPSLEIQAKIVDILDQFTQLEAELEVELEARQQQYAYYRDILVAPRSPRESVKLGKFPASHEEPLHDQSASSSQMMAEYRGSKLETSHRRESISPLPRSTSAPMVPKSHGKSNRETLSYQTP